MHQFIVKSKGKEFSFPNDSKEKLFFKLLNNYFVENKTFKITIENVSQNINEGQISVYRAFIVKASDHFGNTYEEMEDILEHLKPKIEGFNIPVPRWTNKQLDDFINKSTALLADYGFHF